MNALCQFFLMCLYLTLKTSLGARLEAISWAALQQPYRGLHVRLVLIYDGLHNTTIYEAAAEAASRMDVQSVEFVQCNAALDGNSAAYALPSLPTLYIEGSATPGEPLTPDITADGLESVLNHKIAAEDSDEPQLLTFRSEEELYDLLDFSADRKLVLATFYEQWCPHSAELMPMLSRAAAVLSTRAFLMRIECSASTRTHAFCTRNEVHAYPTIILFTGEDKIRYNDVRQVSSIEAFIQQHWVQPVPTAFPAAPQSKTTEGAEEKGHCECATEPSIGTKKPHSKDNTISSADTRTPTSSRKKEKGAKTSHPKAENDLETIYSDMASHLKKSTDESILPIDKELLESCQKCHETMDKLQALVQEYELRLHQLEDYTTTRCHLATLH